MTMNLHTLVRAAINVVNEDQPIIIKINKGNQHIPGGLQRSIWEEINTTAQVQPVSSYEIQFIENYVSSSNYRNFYINGNFMGLNRRTESGGDCIIWNGFEWFIDSSPEPWGDTAGWTKVRAIQQLPSEDT